MDEQHGSEKVHERGTTQLRQGAWRGSTVEKDALGSTMVCTGQEGFVGMCKKCRIVRKGTKVMQIRKDMQWCARCIPQLGEGTQGQHHGSEKTCGGMTWARKAAGGKGKDAKWSMGWLSCAVVKKVSCGSGETYREEA